MSSPFSFFLRKFFKKSSRNVIRLSKNKKRTIENHLFNSFLFAKFCGKLKYQAVILTLYFPYLLTPKIIPILSILINKLEPP